MHKGLDRLLNPRSIAVIGASAQEGKAGNFIVMQLLGGSFRVFAVNAKGDTVFGLPIYRSVQDIPEVPDLAILALPAEAAPGATRDCVKRGIGAVIVVAGGFGEIGEAGRALERELEEAIKGSRTRILGPNTLGVLVPRLKLDTIFLPAARLRRPGPGAVALISQSGSAVMGGMDVAAFYGASLAAFVGLGNRLDVDENELIEYFAHDASTSAIGLYLESFADTHRFVEVCRNVSPRKPIVLLRAGRSSAGARAVQLHTGSLAGSDRVTDGVLRQMGAIRVYDDEELLDAAQALACTRPLSGRRMVVLPLGGGMGIVTADYIEAKERGISSSLAELAPRTREKLARIALPFASVRNPIDLTASATHQMFDAALEILQGDPGVDVILACFGYHPATVDEHGLTQILCHWGREGKKPLVAAPIGSETAIKGIRDLEAAGVPAFPSIWRAVRAVDVLARRGEYLRRVDSSRRFVSVPNGGPASPDCQPRLGVPLAEDEVKAILRERGVQTPDSVVLPQGMLPARLPLSYPVVVKIRSAAVLHKTEMKGVALNIPNRQELTKVIKEMRSRFPGEDLLVEQMEPPGIEIIVGLIEDPTFGLSIMCGMGGILAELYQDVAFRLVPISRAEAEEMLGELKAYPLFEGFRGIRASREAVIDLLLKVSSLGQELTGHVDQMDLNPVIVHADGAVVVDAKLIWKRGLFAASTEEQRING
ncbi:MAG: acetate--CoA ligase family protein [Chloroflexi bacterium]|nr:acetate--CoA ligase family protein [Chloroflexota bacterium]